MGNKTVLIVEDDAVSRLFYKNLFTRNKIKCDTVATEHEVYDLIDNNKYKCIILDYYLGDTNALPILNELKDREIPIIILTSASVNSLERICLLAGAKKVLNKKISNADLIKEIRAHVPL